MTKNIQTKENLQRIENIQCDTLGAIFNIDYNNVNMTVDEKDTMFQGNKLAGYHFAGKSALHSILIALIANGIDIKNVKTVLDFACGYGRVLRYIKLSFPDAKIYACECDEEALKFCASTFQVTPILSGDPNNADGAMLPEKVDLIWVGSLFTHFSVSGWGKFIEFFSSILNPNGLLIFTCRSELSKVVGKKSISPEETILLERGYKENGFGFAQYTASIGGHSNYGLSVSEPGWVSNFLGNYPSLRLASYVERGWMLGQDIVTCIKEDDLD